jgi:hypothetical protein
MTVMRIRAVVFDIGGVLDAGARQAGIQAVLFQDNAQAIRDIGNLLAR